VTKTPERVSTAARLGFRPRIPLEHSVPDGWRPRPAKGFRLLDMGLPGQGEASCLVSYMPGGAGGVVANVNRWRRQMGMDEPLTPEQVAALPRVMFLGQSATLLELEGTYSDSMKGLTREGWKLVGAMAPLMDGMAFVKLTGPKAEVEQQQANFASFVASLRLPQ
jgi:hypothetical protein